MMGVVTPWKHASWSDMEMSSSNYLFLRVDLLGFRKGRNLGGFLNSCGFLCALQDLMQVISEMA